MDAPPTAPPSLPAILPENFPYPDFEQAECRERFNRIMRSQNRNRAEIEYIFRHLIRYKASQVNFPVNFEQAEAEQEVFIRVMAVRKKYNPAQNKAFQYFACVIDRLFWQLCRNYSRALGVTMAPADMEHFTTGRFHGDFTSAATRSRLVPDAFRVKNSHDRKRVQKLLDKSIKKCTSQFQTLDFSEAAECQIIRISVATLQGVRMALLGEYKPIATDGLKCSDKRLLFLASKASEF